MKLLLSIDDGHELDKLSIQLLNKYNLKGLFFIPTDSAGFLNPHWYKGHDVGGHTVTHPSDLKLLSTAQKEREILGNKNDIMAQFNIVPKWFCPPRGRYDEEVLSIAGPNFEYLRTTRVMSTKFVSTKFVQDTTIHCFARKEYNGVDWLDLAKDFVDARPQYLHFWWHSEEVNRFNEWGKLERLFKYIAK